MDRADGHVADPVALPSPNSTRASRSPDRLRWPRGVPAGFTHGGHELQRWARNLFDRKYIIDTGYAPEPGCWRFVGSAELRFSGRQTSLSLAWMPEPCHDGFPTTSPVDARPADPFGIYGVLGNVMESVTDCWHEDHSTGPVDERARPTSGACSYRAMRGKGWMAIAGSARASFRRKMSATERRFTLGIRVVPDWAGG